MATLKLLLGVENARLTCCRVVSLGGFCGLFCGPLVFFPCDFVWVPLRIVIGCFFRVLGFRFCVDFVEMWVSFGCSCVYFLCA
jgi:hypothetical protein